MLATDVDAKLGLITCVWSRIDQMARLAHGFNLIPVSGVREAVDGEKQEETGSKEHSTKT